MIYTQDDHYRGNGLIEEEVVDGISRFRLSGNDSNIYWRQEDNFIEYGDVMGFIAIIIPREIPKNEDDECDYVEVKGLKHGIYLTEQSD